MSTRKIKDAKDLTTNELIYFKGHAQATYMSDGRTVEEAINSVGSGGSNGDSSDFFYFDVLSVIYENDYELDENGNVSGMQFDASEYISEIETAVFNHKFVIILDALQIFNVDAEDFGGSSFYAGTTYYSMASDTWKRINIAFQRSSGEASLNIQDVLGGGGSSGSNITSIKINNVSKTPSNGVVDLGYVSKQLSTTTSSSMTLSPNIYYRNTSTSLSSLTITLGSVSNSNILNEYFVEFTTRSSGTTVSLPSSVKWANGVTPSFENGKTYQISIVNNLGTCVKFG